MALKELNELPRDVPHTEQLTFTAFELADWVAQLLNTKADKKESNEAFNTEIKKIEKEITKLSKQIQANKRV